MFSGVGVPEIVIIGIIVVLLFGPALITFWLGYLVGRNRSVAAGLGAPISPPDASETPQGEDAAVHSADEEQDL